MPALAFLALCALELASLAFLVCCVALVAYGP
jgi:hypothetical protein